MIYNNIVFKKYDNYYYVSENGDIYSKYKNGLLKHNIDINGYHRVDIHGKHMKVHRMVYTVWNGIIPDDKQVNHYDDNKDNNNYKNLYLGNQKENIDDCKKNQHRVGNVFSIKVYDKAENKILEFPTIKEFIKYTGHSSKNGSISKMQNKKWFKQRFDIIEKKRVTTIESYISIKESCKNDRIENKTKCTKQVE